MVSIDKSTLDFFSDLKKNNSREWFQQNRNSYIKAKSNFELFIQTVIGEITRFDPILKGLEAKTCMYRINRDIRFSNDKTLYKTHMGAFIVRGGKKNGDKFAGYYIHVEPGNNSMIAGGAYMPPAPWLRHIREKINGKGDKFVDIIENVSFRKTFGQIEGEKLRSAPRGFQNDHKYIELLKMKSYLVTRMISDKEIVSSDCFEMMINAARVMKPFNDFLNDC